MGWISPLSSSSFDEVFDNCDLEFAREQLRYKFAGGIFPQALVALFDEFDRNPTRKNAEALIRHEPTFVVLFEDNISTKRFMGEHTRWNDMNSRGVPDLQLESEFEELVVAITDDRDRYRELVETLTNRGYSKETISSAIALYYQELNSGY